MFEMVSVLVCRTEMVQCHGYSLRPVSHSQKKDFKSAMVNEPSVFQQLRFDCMSIKIFFHVKIRPYLLMLFNP